MNFRTIRILTIVSAVLFSSSALAYIPPAAFILNEALKVHSSEKTLVMEGMVTDLRDQSSLREVLRIDFGSGRMSASYFHDTEAVGTYDTHVKDIHRLGKFWITLGIDSNHARFHEALEELNVTQGEGAEVKLARVGSRVVWAWGSDPFIAFFKDEFLPSEYKSGVGASDETILINEYTPDTIDIRVPKDVLVKLQGKDTYHYELKNVKLNQTLKFNQAQSSLKTPFAKEWATLVR